MHVAPITYTKEKPSHCTQRGIPLTLVNLHSRTRERLNFINNPSGRRAHTHAYLCNYAFSLYIIASARAASMLMHGMRSLLCIYVCIHIQQAFFICTCHDLRKSLVVAVAALSVPTQSRSRSKNRRAIGPPSMHTRAHTHICIL